jgi:SecD-like export protein
MTGVRWLGDRSLLTVHGPLFTVHCSLFTLFVLLACSPAGEKVKAADWGRVPVAIELRLAEGAPAPGLVPAAVYGQADTVYLHPEPELSNTHIARVEAVKTRIATGLVLQVWLTKAGATRIADVTAHHIGDSLAVLINSVLVSVPVIQETIDPGTRQPSDIGVPLGTQEAEQLARAVSQTWHPAQRKGDRETNRSQ